MIKLNKLDGWYRFDFDANFALYRTVRKIFLGAISKWNRKSRFRVWMCVEEAISNAIRYGSKERASLDFKLTSETLIVRISGYGGGFNPNDILDCTKEENLSRERGRGIKLMRDFSAYLEYNEKGNVVEMLFYRHKI